LPEANEVVKIGLRGEPGTFETVEDGLVCSGDLKTDRRAGKSDAVFIPEGPAAEVGVENSVSGAIGSVVETSLFSFE
jgi:hypothetical protein